MMVNLVPLCTLESID